jgi:hypothetical protein
VLDQGAGELRGAAVARVRASHGVERAVVGERADLGVVERAVEVARLQRRREVEACAPAW